jgi:mycothiol synthase
MMIIRNFSWDDFPEIVAISNQFAKSLGSTRNWTYAELEEQWRAPYNNPEENCFLAILPEQGLVGYLIVDLLDVPNQANGVYRVLLGYPEAGRALIQHCEAYFRNIAVKNSPAEQEIFMLYALPSQALSVFDLLAEEAYKHIRSFYTMRMVLNQPVLAIEVPQEFKLRAYQPEHDAQMLYEAEREIFQEHWGNYEQSFDEWIYPSKKPDFDPRWWWLLLEGEAIVGLILSEARNDEMAWISILGVKKAYRQRGLAQVLLQQCFASHQAQGRKIIELGVDAESESKASRLYFKAGMHLRQTIEYYRKTLREGLSL